MCGIAGLISNCNTSGQKPDSIVNAMIGKLVHRGPDDHGVWYDEKAGVALGHRRLSIIDLSKQGHQPMVSACGRFVTVFNGEIYNFKELRKSLESSRYTFRGYSDTEVLLVAISEWGLEKAVQRFNGMFAIAIWDRKENQLHLVSDRMGEKPLYYGWKGDVFLFASELKALRAYEKFDPVINRDALGQYFRYKYVPYPYSIYEGIYKLAPGCIQTISPRQKNKKLEAVPYWSLSDIVENGLAQTYANNEREVVDNFENILGEAVEMRMVSDVPLGAFLSGGIDSSSIVALMQSRRSRPVETFSIGFNEADYDEAIYAKAVAKHLRTSHTELYVTANEAIDVIPSLVNMYDEPFADSSQIPTHLVAKLARQHVTVSLSGDGGDELFAGYWRHLMATEIWDKAQCLPEVLRRLSSNAITSLSPTSWDSIRRSIEFLLPKKLHNFPIGDRAYKLARIVNSRNEGEVYRALISDWTNPEQLVLGGSEPQLDSMTNIESWGPTDFRNQMMYL